MAAEKDDLITLYDRAPLNGRYWTSLALVTSTSIFDFFDFFIVGFLVAVLSRQWHLTFGQSSIMLLSAGVGAIIGSLLWGAWADRWGRKKLLIAGVVLCALGGGTISFIPDNAWILFSALRFLVGVAIGAVATVALPLMVEYTPTRHRTLLSSVTLIPVSLGILAASVVAATLLPHIGWRGVAALGFLPLVSAILIAPIIPESVRWLVSHGKHDEARRIVGRALNVSPDTLPRPAITQGLPSGSAAPAPRYADLLAYPKLVWLTVLTWLGATTAIYGVLLWGPTIVAMLMDISAGQAARFFVVVSLTGVLGRAVFSFLAQWLGRRRCGEIMGYGVALLLGAVALFYDRTLFGYPAFLVLLIPAALFFDGGFANIAPYAAEVFPVQLSARGVGLSQATNGIGKILGPLCLALIAGTSNFITPKATLEAVTPAFLFLAGCGLVVGLAFSFLGVETHGKPLNLNVESEDEPANNYAEGSYRVR